MATKSILKNINIKEKHMGRSLVNALERAEEKTTDEVTISKSCSDVRRDQIKTLFGANNGEQRFD
ncbi:MAG: hypothetical protein GX236_05345 [Clostridiaceae bacterium]|nr:hypothetical protein [Clostridiaceae bacterium]